jgi:hypothetical protein
VRAEHKRQYLGLVKGLNQAISDRSDREDVWERSEELYSGRFDVDAIDPTEQIYPNMIQPTINVIVAAALSRRPEIAVTPRKVENAARARLQIGLNRYFWETFDIQTEAQEALRDAGISGIGVLKTIWRYEEQRYTEPDPEDIAAMREYRDQLGLVLGDLPADDKVYEFLKRKAVQVIDNRPEARRISYWEVFVDSQARSLREINWIAHRYWRPLEEVEGDEFLRESVRKSYRSLVTDPAYPENPSHNLENPEGPMRRRVFNDTSGTDMIELVEIWDLRRRRLYICRWEDLGNPERLLYEGLWPFKVGHPFVFLTFGPSFSLPDQVYPLSLAEMIGPEQYELTTIARELMRQRLYTKQRFVGDEEMITDDVEEVLRSDVNGAIAKLSLNGRDVREVLMELPGLRVDPQLYQQQALIEAMIVKKTGITEYQRGLVSGNRSATEVSTVDEYAQGRVNLLLHSVQQAMVELARKMMGLCAQYMTTKQVARIIDVDPNELPPNPDAYMLNGNLVYPFDRDDIAGEYDYSMAVTAAMADTPQARAQRLLQFAQAFAQDPFVNRAAIAVEFAKEIGLQNPERFITPPAPPPPPDQGGLPGQPSLPGVPGLAPGGGQPPGLGRQMAAAGAMGGVQRAAAAGRRGPIPVG